MNLNSVYEMFSITRSFISHPNFITIKSDHLDFLKNKILEKCADILKETGIDLKPKINDDKLYLISAGKLFVENRELYDELMSLIYQDEKEIDENRPMPKMGTSDIIQQSEPNEDFSFNDLENQKPHPIIQKLEQTANKFFKTKVNFHTNEDAAMTYQGYYKISELYKLIDEIEYSLFLEELNKLIITDKVTSEHGILQMVKDEDKITVY